MQKTETQMNIPLKRHLYLSNNRWLFLLLPVLSSAYYILFKWKPIGTSFQSLLISYSLLLPMVGVLLFLHIG